MRAAFYELEFTPPLGGFMWGHYKDIRAMDVIDRLYIKAVVTEHEGKYAAIIGIDTCSLLPDMQKIVAKRVAEYTPIPAESICITSNHAHSGAPISADPSVGAEADTAYVDVFLRLCADAVTLAYRRLEDVEMKFAKTEVHDIAFCRNFVLEGGGVATHSAGKPVLKPLDDIDPDLPVLFFERDGKKIGAIINYACHQCCLDHYTGGGYSGDYASYISKHLKEVYGQDFVSLFVLGFCGDINHVNPNLTEPRPANWYRQMGKILADAVVEAEKSAQSVPAGVDAIMEEIEIDRRTMTPEEAKAQVMEWFGKGDSFMRSRNLLHYRSSHMEQKSDVLPIQALVIGDVLISALPGEIYNAYGRAIKAASPFKRNMTVENCNEYCGYVPTLKAFEQPGRLYETSLCRHSCLIPEAGTIMQEKVLELAGKLAK